MVLSGRVSRLRAPPRSLEGMSTRLTVELVCDAQRAPGCHRAYAARGEAVPAVVFAVRKEAESAGWGREDSRASSCGTTSAPPAGPPPSRRRSRAPPLGGGGPQYGVTPSGSGPAATRPTEPGAARRAAARIGAARPAPAHSHSHPSRVSSANWRAYQASLAS